MERFQLTEQDLKNITEGEAIGLRSAAEDVVYTTEDQTEALGQALMDVREHLATSGDGVAYIVIRIDGEPTPR